MRLINDEDFVPIARGPVANIVPDFAHFVNPAVRGGIDLDDVNGIPFGNLDAARAYAAWSACGSFDAVQAARQNARNACLAGSALARKDVAMGQPITLDGVRKCLLNVLLPDEVVEGLRTILPRNHLVHRIS